MDSLRSVRQNMNDLRDRIGVVPQKALLFKGSIRENLLWGNPDADEKALTEAINKALADMKTDGTMDEIGKELVK